MKLQDKVKNRVILVEDSETDTYLFKHYFGKFFPSINLDTYDNGQSALNILLKLSSKQEYKVTVILDLNLPELNGIEILRELNRNKKIGNMEIVILSGSKNPEDKSKCLSLGAIDFHIKPMNMEGYEELMTNSIEKILS